MRADVGVVCKPHPRHSGSVHDQISDLALDNGQARGRHQPPLHLPPVDRAVRLRARSLHGRSLAAVQQTELDARLVRHATHQAVERIHLTDKMTFAQTADGGVAGHHADGVRA